MINKKYFLILFLFLTPTIFGQFQTNKNIVGPSVGFSFLGSSIQFGLNHEYGIVLDESNSDGSGKIGIGGIFRYWSYKEEFPVVEWSYSNILIGVQTNYHFQISKSDFDPWAGLILAYNFGSVKSKIILQNVQFDRIKNGGVFIGANAGLRYWIDGNTALSMRIGFGNQNYGALDLGLEFILD